MRLYLLVVLALFGACQSIVIPTQVVTINGSSSPSPGATPTTPAAFDSVSVEIFEHVACPNAPERGELVIRVGCTARITATPKAHGIDVPSSGHGPDCTWFFNGQRLDGALSSATVQIATTSNPFNLTATGQANGAFSLEAEVQGVRSGSKLFTVR